ncbi:restriction endonuclease subunit S [Vibrio parahaemolyticus]|nr:restriction endonuclease subunit S [Vibrio parahaemolyticus]
MELKTIPCGYKHTDVGVIPQDWSVVAISDISITGIGMTPSRNSVVRYFDKGTHWWAKTTDLNNAAISETEERITDIALKETSLKVYPAGTVLVAMYGNFNQIGRTGFTTVPVCVNQTLVAIYPIDKRLNSRFLFHYLNYRADYWKTVASNSRKDPHITSRDVKSLSLPLPTFDEQTAIANALCDVDDLIASLEKLIAKKRNVKAGAMQQLLTGKVRLPQFANHPDGSPKGMKTSKLGDNIPEDWEVVPFSTLVDLVSSRIDPKRTGGGEKCVELEHIGPGMGLITGFTMTTETSSHKSVFQCGDVLFGKLRSYLQKYWIAEFDGVCSTEIWVFRAKPGVFNRFINQIVRTDSFISCASEGYGTHMPRSDWKTVKNQSIIKPCMAEQSAISEVLEAFDDELHSLSNQLTKVRMIKQGMMQELLTGKTRLV